ncbi:MAG: SCO family protein [Phycisphaerales bacterium JB059]
MKSVVISILVAAVLAAIGALIVVGMTSIHPRSPNSLPGAAPGLAAEDNPFADFSMPDFQLTDQDGRSVSAEILDGRVTVLDFFFTTCPGPCPGMTAQMAYIQEQTEGTPVRLLSVSVDGDDDTPEVLRAYASSAGADLERWTFLTGNPDDVARIVRDGLKFEISPIEDSPIYDETGAPRIGPSGKPLVNIAHPTRFILIGPDRGVIDIGSYNNPADVERLIERAKAAAG